MGTSIDEHRFGRPSTARTDANVVRKVILKDRLWTIEEGSCGSIWIDLEFNSENFKRFDLLTVERQRGPMEACFAFREEFRNDPNFLSNEAITKSVEDFRAKKAR